MGITYLESLVAKVVEESKRWEGSADEAEQNYLSSLAKGSEIKRIGEIGFNAGISSYAFLSANPKVHVYSFDLGEYVYVNEAKRHIDETFPDRHTLIIGDSRQTVPEFRDQHPEIYFDLIFIDGGHDYKIAKADIMNMRALATKDTLLVTDDLMPWKPWGVGPTKAWLEALQEGVVTQKELYKDGKKVETIEPPGDRSWVLGSYKIPHH